MRITGVLPTLAAVTLDSLTEEVFFQLLVKRVNSIVQALDAVSKKAVSVLVQLFVVEMMHNVCLQWNSLKKRADISFKTEAVNPKNQWFKMIYGNNRTLRITLVNVDKLKFLFLNKSSPLRISAIPLE